MSPPGPSADILTRPKQKPLTRGILPISSLAWLELRTVLAKLLWTYDLRLVNEEIDWHRDSRMLTLWWKPLFWVKATPRAFVQR